MPSPHPPIPITNNIKEPQITCCCSISSTTFYVTTTTILFTTTSNDHGANFPPGAGREISPEMAYIERALTSNDSGEFSFRNLNFGFHAWISLLSLLLVSCDWGWCWKAGNEWRDTRVCLPWKKSQGKASRRIYHWNDDWRPRLPGQALACIFVARWTLGLHQTPFPVCKLCCGLPTSLSWWRRRAGLWEGKRVQKSVQVRHSGQCT